jgi:hypothetical protein
MLNEISDQQLYGAGFVNSISSNYQNQTISSIDRALYYFGQINKGYDNIWFIEDDVFFYSEDTLLNIDRKYQNSDLLTSQTIFNTKAFRASKKLIQYIAGHADQNKTLDCIQTLLPKLAFSNNLCHDKPDELQYIKESHEWNYDDINKYCLYHPMKNLIEHEDCRSIERFN